MKLAARTLPDRHELVGREWTDPLCSSARPCDVQRLDVALVFEAEVYSKVALRQIAPAAVNLRHQRASVHPDSHPRTDRIVVALAATSALNDHAVIAAANLFQAHTDWHTKRPPIA